MLNEQLTLYAWNVLIASFSVHMIRWRRLNRRVCVSAPSRSRMGGRLPARLLAVGDFGSGSLSTGKGFLPFTTWITAFFIPTTGKRSVIHTYILVVSVLIIYNKESLWRREIRTDHSERNFVAYKLLRNLAMDGCIDAIRRYAHSAVDRLLQLKIVNV